MCLIRAVLVTVAFKVLHFYDLQKIQVLQTGKSNCKTLNNFDSSLKNKLNKQKYMRCFESFDGLCKQIVSPARFKINESEIIERETKSMLLEYRQFEVISNRNQHLSCLLFINDLQRLPTILYLHGNGGSKMEVLPILRVENKRVNVCAFDFSGCGRSDGEYVTYGSNEASDVKSVVDYLRRTFQIHQIHLWGRSMGACAAILYAAHTSESMIRSMILDCPFTCLQKVIQNVASHQSIPSFIFYVAFYFLKNKVNALVGKDVFSEHYDEVIRNVKNIPMLFGYSTKDYMVSKEDVRRIYENYSGEKYKYGFQNGHSEERPVGFIQEAARFVLSKNRAQSRKPIELSQMRTSSGQLSQIIQIQYLNSKYRNQM